MYKVEGYEFETKEQAKIAGHEVEQVRYFKNQISMDDPDLILGLYNRLIVKEVFVTPVGIGFLRELQEYLDTIPYIKKEDILSIPVYRPELIEEEHPKEEQLIQKRARKRRRQKAQEVRRFRRRHNRDYQKLFHISTFFAIVFALVIVGMFLIVGLSADNVNIINYENAIVDKYEHWEEELKAREEQLDQREKELDRQEGQD